MKYFVLLLVVSQSFFLSRAQRSIEGSVIDNKTREPLIGAHVYLLNNWRKGDITDIEGKFSLTIKGQEMNDSLIVSYIGFTEQVIPLAKNLIIKLEAVQEEGETVVVTAKPLISEEFKYMEIQKLEIYTNPAAKADPLLAVNSLPSSTTTDESANISLRGSSPIETGVFFNNVPIYDAVRYSQLNGIGTFSIFNTDIIKSVTVFPGNPPLEFGNTTSGIVSMETDDKIVKENANSFIASLANIGFSRQQKISSSSSLKLFTNWQPSGPIKAVNQEALEDIKSFSSNDLGIYWYGNNNRLVWKVLAYGNTEGYTFKFEHPSYIGSFMQDKQRLFLISSMERALGPGNLSVNGGSSISRGDFEYSNVAFQVDKRDVFGGINYLLTDPKYSLKAGVSFDQRQASLAGTFHEVEYALGPGHPTISLDEEVSISVPEGYTYFKYFVSDKVSLGTGLRKNLPNNEVDDYLSRQLNGSYTDDTWTIMLGYGSYHKNSLLENTGEPFSAINDQFSLDVKYSISGLNLAISFFDKIGSIDSVNYSARGIELYADKQFNSNLSASGSLTLLDATSQSESYLYDLAYFLRGNVSWNPARSWTIESIIVARQGTLTNEVVAASFDADLSVYMPTYAETATRISPYINVGLSISKVIAVNEEVSMIAFASLNNMFDRKNTRDYAYNFDYSMRSNILFSRRTGYFGVVINF